MRFLPQKNEEPASLSKWLSRDIPHERELAQETLQTMGREKSLDALLRLHDLEETRRQKHIRWSGYFMLPFMISALWSAVGMVHSEISMTHGNHSNYFLLMMASTMPIHGYNLWARTGNRKKTPLFSTSVQQNVITTLLEESDSPLIADALSRSLNYYSGDRSALYQKLAQILPLLPDDKEALTKPARHTLRFFGNTPVPKTMSETEKESRLLLQAAIVRYRARTETPTPKTPHRVGAKMRAQKRLETTVRHFWERSAGSRQE